VTRATRIDRFDQPHHETPIDVWLLGRLLAGWTPRAVAVASAGRISLRTAYRWRKAIMSIETVRVGPYEAEFAVRRRRGPIRVSEWRRR
jgi:hypothetical protein